ncbi:MAG: hypothetical protein K2W82_10770 [Candidatus Obscuribacterales bacterium]|nr:hypothetical protein [Candidatus Obscuribacterales bacterium]
MFNLNVSVVNRDNLLWAFAWFVVLFTPLAPNPLALASACVGMFAVYYLSFAYSYNRRLNFFSGMTNLAISFVLYIAYVWAASHLLNLL